MQGYLAKVGVNVKITQYEWGAYLDTYAAHAVGGVRDRRVVRRQRRPGQLPRRPVRVRRGGRASRGPTTTHRHHDAAYDKLIVQGRQVTDQAKRAADLQQANKMLHDDAPWIFINHTNQVRATRANVTRGSCSTRCRCSSTWSRSGSSKPATAARRGGAGGPPAGRRAPRRHFERVRC